MRRFIFKTIKLSCLSGVCMLFTSKQYLKSGNDYSLAFQVVSLVVRVTFLDIHIFLLIISGISTHNYKIVVRCVAQLEIQCLAFLYMEALQ